MTKGNLCNRCGRPLELTPHRGAILCYCDYIGDTACPVQAEPKRSTPMTKTEYLEFHKNVCERMTAITKAKNADYTGDTDDPFANFSRVEALGITDTARGFLVRMSDKLSRITSFVQKGVLEVKDESVEDTLFDLANYCILMAGYIKSRKK